MRLIPFLNLVPFSPGPTIISTATLEAIASWYPGLDVEEVRLRFRTNIEISGVPAFWEDQLFAEPEDTVNFQMGNVQFMGINPCQRCVVITRDSQTGETDLKFQKTFVTQRQTTLPEWAERSRFNHFYRLAINTRLPVTEAGKKFALVMNSEFTHLILRSKRCQLRLSKKLSNRRSSKMIYTLQLLYVFCAPRSINTP